MGLYKVKINSLFNLEQQNELYNDFLELQAACLGLKEFIDSRGLTLESQIFMFNYMRNINYTELKRKLEEKKI